MTKLSDVNRMTLYMSKESRAMAKQLAEVLAEEGAIKRDNKGAPSVSDMVRYLVEKELKRKSKKS